MATILWTEPLAGLLPALRELRLQAPEERTIAKLPRGAFVELVTETDGREKVRIGRPTAPETPYAIQRWQTEIETFQKHLGLGKWIPIPTSASKGVIVTFGNPT